MIYVLPFEECFLFIRAERGRAHTTRHGDRPGHLDRDGYGRCWDERRKKQSLAHRLVFERMIRPLAENEVVHHVCQRRACLNPAHLEALPRGEHAKLHAELRRQRRASGAR